MKDLQLKGLVPQHHDTRSTLGAHCGGILATGDRTGLVSGVQFFGPGSFLDFTTQFEVSVQQLHKPMNLQGLDPNLISFQ